MFKETKIFSHKDLKLKNAYHDIYYMLKSIKSFEKDKPNYLTGLKPDFYVDIIYSNKSYPQWLKVQMIKLVKKRIKLIKTAGVKKWFEFRIIVPKKDFQWVGNWHVPTDGFVRHITFDSRCIFMDIGKKRKNDPGKSILK